MDIASELLTTLKIHLENHPIDFQGQAHWCQARERMESSQGALPVSIGNNVFIGCQSIILMGTTIGDNSIVGAGSVVKGEFPAGVIIAGNPARVICMMTILSRAVNDPSGKASWLCRCDCGNEKVHIKIVIK